MSFTEEFHRKNTRRFDLIRSSQRDTPEYRQLTREILEILGETISQHIDVQTLDVRLIEIKRLNEL